MFLKNILLENGFRKITYLDERNRGNRRFRIGYNKVIIFDYEFQEQDKKH